MEGSEISNKLKAAIKAKLMELGVYVDDQLPNYVMVLVTNKRSKHEIERELQLFLGENASEFSTWLHSVWKKLEQVTVRSSVKASIKKRASESSDKKKKKKVKRDQTTDSDSEKKRKKEISHSEESVEEKLDMMTDDDEITNVKSKDGPEKPKIHIKAGHKTNESEKVETKSSETGKTMNLQPKPDENECNNLGKPSPNPSSKSKKDLKSPEKTDDFSIRDDGLEEEDFLNIKEELDDFLFEEDSLVDDGKNKKLIEVTEEAPAKKVKSELVESKVTKIVESIKHSDMETDDITRTSAENKSHNRVSPANSKPRLNRDLMKEPKASRESKTSVGSNVTKAVNIIRPGNRIIRYPSPPLKKDSRFDSKNSDLKTISRVISQSDVKRTTRLEEKLKDGSEDAREVLNRKRSEKSLRSVDGHQRYSDEDKRDKQGSRLESRSRNMKRGSDRYEKSPIRITRDRSRRRSISPEWGDRNRVRRIDRTVLRRNRYSSESDTEKNPRVEPKRKHDNVDKDDDVVYEYIIDDDEETVDNDLERKENEDSVPLDGGPSKTIRGKAQPNRPGFGNLIRRAVEDAHKSLSNSHHQHKKERYASSDRKESGKSSTSRRETSPQKSKSIREKSLLPQREKRIPFRESRESKVLSESNRVLPKYLDGSSSQNGCLKEKNTNQISEFKAKSESIKASVLAVQAALASTANDAENVEQYDPTENMPQFVVTLTGLDPKLFTESSDINMEEIIEDDINMDCIKEKQEKEGTRAKTNERCKFWPNCMNGEQCTFVHPSSPCALFPNCKFGNSCLYIHPKCKFDSLCTRYDCQFLHTDPQALRTIPPPPVIKSHSSMTYIQPCKYFPNCSNTTCPFQHPKPCRYDRFCTNKGCLFTHTSLLRNNNVYKDKLRWSNPQLQASAGSTSIVATPNVSVSPTEVTTTTTDEIPAVVSDIVDIT